MKTSSKALLESGLGPVAIATGPMLAEDRHG
jgi:hypothetical protein